MAITIKSNQRVVDVMLDHLFIGSGSFILLDQDHLFNGSGSLNHVSIRECIIYWINNYKSTRNRI